MLCGYRDAQMIMEDIKRTISELEQESSLPAVGVELVDNELATLYMNSKKSEVNSYTLFIARRRAHLWFWTVGLNAGRVAHRRCGSFCRLISGIILPCCDRLSLWPERFRIL